MGDLVPIDRLRHKTRLISDAGADSTTERPRTRGDCEQVPRPCPFVSCKHNLFLDVGNGGRGPGLILSGVDPSEMPPHLSCALDVADEVPGGATTEMVAEAWGCTHQNVSRIEQDVLRRPHVRAWAEQWRGHRSRPDVDDPAIFAPDIGGRGPELGEEDDPLTARVWNTYERESRALAGGLAIAHGADGRVVRPRDWRKEDRPVKPTKPVSQDAERLILQMAEERGDAGFSAQQAADAARLPTKGAAYVLLEKLEGRGLLARARGRNRYRIKSPSADARVVSANVDSETRDAKVRRLARELEELADTWPELQATPVHECVAFLRRAA